AIDTLSTAGVPEKLQATPSRLIVVTRGPAPWRSARAPDHILNLLRGFGALLHPEILVVVDELDVGELRHLPGQLRKVEISPRGTAEREPQDLLPHVLARDIIRKLLRVPGIRSALDDC